MGRGLAGHAVVVVVGRGTRLLSSATERSDPFSTTSRPVPPSEQFSPTCKGIMGASSDAERRGGVRSGGPAGPDPRVAAAPKSR